VRGRAADFGLRAPGLAFAGVALVAVLSAGCTLIPTLRGPPPPTEAAPRASLRPPDELQDARGGLHVHSVLSHDSHTSFEEIGRAARATDTKWVAVTDHFTPFTVSLGPRGKREGVLFLVGAEIKRAKGSILAVGIGDVPTPTAQFPLRRLPTPTQATIDRIKRDGGLAFIGHIEHFAAWDLERFDGIEVANLHKEVSEEKWRVTALSFLFETPSGFFRRMTDRPDDNIRRWDLLAKERRMPGVGGCDAHGSIRFFGPLGGAIGDHEECFRVLTTHVLVPEVTGPEVAAALAEGRCYIAYEIDGDASGFGFDLHDTRARGGPRWLARMGDEVAFRPGLRVSARAPGGDHVRIDIMCDGYPVARGEGGFLETSVDVPGVYRVEAYLDDEPFILSNPIYVRGKAMDR
jgi:hypothetical protein